MRHRHVGPPHLHRQPEPPPLRLCDLAGAPRRAAISHEQAATLRARIVLAAVRDGHSTRGAIITATMIERRAVDHALEELRWRGLVRHRPDPANPGRYLYEPAG